MHSYTRLPAATAAEVLPLVDATLAFTRHRLAEIDAEVAGVPYRPEDPSWSISTALVAGARHDPELVHAYAEIGSLRSLPSDLFATPGLLDDVLVHAGRPRYAAGSPTRAELLDSIASALMREGTGARA